MYANRLKLSVHNIAAAIVLTALCATVGFVAFPVSNDAQAAIPKIINFQGKLTAVSNGNNVANGTYAFEFKIYDAVTSGTLLWTETFDQPSGACGKLTVTNGVFNAKLGSCNALTGVDFTGGSLYLTVNFAPTGTSYDGEMSPRKQLVSSAFAFVANSVSGDGLVNNAIQSTTALATGRTLANPALQVDTNTASSATGLKVTSAAAAGGLALTTISSGTNENLTIDAKGSGTININGSATGDILLGGGSASTGCTVTNSSGALACTAGGSFTTLGLSGAISGATGITSSGTITFSGLGGGGTQCVTADNTGVLGVAACGSAITPWTSDIDADGFDLQDLSNVEFRETTGAPAGSVVAIFRDNSGDLTANVLTGKTYNIAVNGTDEYNFSSTTLNLNSNTITNAASFNGLVVTANTGVVTTGTWQGTAVADTYVADTLTVDSSSSVHWNALNNYPAACSAGSAISQLADTTNTCTAFNTDTSITLQDAYNQGGTIETASNVPVIITETTASSSTNDLLQLTFNPGAPATASGDALQIVMDGGDSGSYTGNGIRIEIDQSQASGNAILIEDDAGTDLFVLDNNGALTLGAASSQTTAITITDTDYTNALSIADNNIIGTTAAIDFTNFDLNSSGAITTGTWNGTAIGSQYGGTGQNWSGTSGLPSLNSGTWSANAITQNGVAYGGASNAMSFTAQGGANTVLVANAGAPSFSAAITVGTSVTSPTINATTALQFGGANINTAGTLTNVAYLNQANVFTADQTVTKADPSIVLNVTTATDTDFWLGVQDDAGGDDDDIFQIGDGTTPGTNPFLTINTSGNVGIGVTAPLSLLHVQQSADSTGTSNPIALNVNSVGAAGELTASSGVQVFSQIAPYINQTSTAGYTALLINATHNGTGSGTKNLIDFQVGGSSLARVDSTGKLFTPAVQGTSNLTITANPGNYVYIGDNADIVVQNRVAYLGNPGMYPNTPTQITSDQNDYSLPNDGKSWHRLSTDASRNITGFAPSYSTAQAGIFDLITNVGSFNIVLKHQDTGSTAANRLLNSTGADITLAPNESADIIYDATVSRWRVYKRADGAGTGGQTPWTSAIDADGYALQDALNIEFRTAAGSAPAGSVIAVFADNSGDLTANVVSGKTFNVAVNGTDEYNFSSTALSMNSNNITGLGTTLSATAGLTIGTASANLALQTTTSGNITMAPASTGSIQVTSGVTTGTTTSSALSVAANSLTSGSGLYIASSTLTSGALIDLAVTGTAGLTNQKGINVSLSGANGTGGQTTYGGYFSNTHTGTSVNVGLYATATGGSVNNAAIFENGSVGIGTVSPSGTLEVYSTVTSQNQTYYGTLITLDNSIPFSGPGASFTRNAFKASHIFTGTVSAGNGDTVSLYGSQSEMTFAGTASNSADSVYAIGSKIISVGDIGTTPLLSKHTGLEISTSGTADLNVGLDLSVGSATTNYAILTSGGNVGISDSTPAALLTVGSGDLFQVNSSGAIAAAAGITSSGTITFSGLGGSGTRCVQVNNSGVLAVAAAACGGGSLTPWTSDIDADGFDLQDLSNVEFRETTGAPAGSVVAIFRDNSGDLNINTLTGKTTNIQVNGTDEYNFSSTALAMNSNNITGLGTTLSATAGLAIGTTSADLALQTTTSGNITATTATTSGIFNVLTGNLKVGAGSPGVTLNGDDAYITGTFEVDGAAQFDGAVTNNSTATFNGLATFNTDADFTYAGTENIAITNTTGSNAVDLISLTLTNNDAGSAVQRGIAVNNADSTAVTDSGIFINNADTTSASLLDGILITSTGVNNGITDAIDVSDGNINNALNVGANTITGAGYLVTSTASGLTLNSTSANLAIQTTTSGNITMAPASTGSVQITAGTTTGTGTSAGLSVATSTATSGSAVDITVTGANALTNQKGINVSTSGAVTGAQTTYGVYFSNTHSGASAVNVGLYATASGASGANYAAIFDQGNVGIGDTSPLSLLTVGSGDLFQVASTGATTITSAQSATLGVTNTADSPGSYVATFTGSTGTNGTSGVLSTTKGFSQFIARSSTHTDRELRFQVFSDGVTYFGPTTTSGTVDADLIIRTSADAGSNTGDITISPGGSALAYFMNGGVVGIGTSGADRKLDVLDASNPQLRLTTTDGTVYGDFQNTANANAIITGNTFTSSSAKQYGLQVAPTINQTSSASYTGLDVNVTETAATTLNGLNRIADFRVGGSSKVAITPSGTIQIQNGGNFISSYSSLGSFQNHLVRSQEFDNASWVKTNVTAPTANTQNGPDGSATAESLATSSSGGDVCQWSGTAAGSNTFTFSVWARSSSGTQNFDLRIDAGATSCATANNVTGTAVTHTATTSWQRFSVTQTFSSATGNVKTRIFPGGTGGTGTVYAWGAQLDQASTAGGYAFTTGGALTNTNRGETLLSNFATTSGFTYGGRHIVGLEGAISASSSTIGEFIRVIDNATGTDDTATVRGLEVQAFSGTNINGINTGIASFGYTFGVHAVSTGQANEAVQPAALFADLDNGSAPTQGNAIRAYSNDLTSADLVSFYQETSAFTGNGLEMNFGVGAGSFTGNFISLQKAGTENFRVDDTGEVYLTTTATTSLNGLCHASTGAATADRVVDCSGTPSDIAEWYETKPDTQAAEIVSMTDEQFTYSEKDFNPFTGLPTGTTTQHSISILQKSLKAYDSKLFGVVSTSPNQVMGEAVRDKGAHPLPIALKGRVLVKVTNENGEIKAGDYITSSATVPGAGMKASRSGQVVGRAMNDFDAASGTVLVFMEVGFQSIGNAIVLDAPTIDGQNLQSGNEDLTSNAASTFVIQQQGAEGDETGGAVSDILQLQSGDSNRFMVSSTGATSILSNLTCTEEDEDTGAISCPSVLKVTQADTELMNIDAHGTLTLAGTIFIKDDSFAGSVATDENGLAEITFSYNLGTGKPVVQLTAEASIPVFAQIMEFKQDEHGNYTGFVMKTFDLISGPIQAIVHYNVTGKQEGYITLGEVLDEPQVPVFSGYSGDDGQVSGDYTGGDGAGLIIENGEVVGGDGNEDSDSIQTNDGSGEISNSDNSGLGGGI